MTRNDALMMSLPKQLENADFREPIKLYIIRKALTRAVQKGKFYNVRAIFSKVVGI